MSQLQQVMESPPRPTRTASVVLMNTSAFALEPRRELLTLLFTDIVGSTTLAERLGDEGWRVLLASHHATVRALLARFRGREIDKAGDGFFSAFDCPGSAIRCAHAIRDALRGLGIDIRAGVHAGECDVCGDQVSGLAVHVAARVATVAAPGEVLVTGTVRDLLAGSDLHFCGGTWQRLKGLSRCRLLFASKGVTEHCPGRRVDTPDAVGPATDQQPVARQPWSGERRLHRSEP